MNNSVPPKIDGIAAAIRSLPRWVNVLFLALCFVYVAMPRHLVPIVGQIDLAAVAWFAWQNWKALRRPTKAPAPLARTAKEVEDVQSV